MSKKIQIIKPSKKVRGVRVVVFCGKCKRELTKGICFKTHKNRCPFKETHHNLKYYLNVPKGKGERVAKVLKGIKSVDEAQRIAMNHKQELKNRPITQEPPPPIPLPQTNQQKEEPEEQPLLEGLLAMHMDVLANHNVAPHLQRPRSEKYLDDISRGYKYLVEGLKKEGVDLKSYYITDLNDSAVGIIHDYFLNKQGLNFSNRSYSKYMQFYSTFLDWCINEQGIGKINYFKKVPKRVTHYTPQTITKENFDKLIEKITPENGIQLCPGKDKSRRNIYKSWLPFAFKIALETGRRRSEITRIRWSEIFSQDSVPIYIKVLDNKVTSIMNLQDSEKKYVYVPITSSLYELIKDGYEEYLKTKKDGYIIAPEITENREIKIGDALSRGFAHYYQLVNPNEKEQLQFGCLRKTYLTSMEIHSKGQTAIVSGHGSGGKIILNKHYIDPKAIASVNVSNGFSVFQEENSKRKEELAKIREGKNAAERNLEI